MGLIQRGAARDIRRTRRTRFPSLQSLQPGLLLCLGAAVVAFVVNLLAPANSPLVTALILGVALTNMGLISDTMKPGIDFSAKTLLRAGIVLLGLQIALHDVSALGIPMLLVMVTIVAGGIAGTYLLGAKLGVPPRLALLIACGFSICGAAAVAGISGALRKNEETERDTVTAVGLVVIFGSLMIPLIPLLSTWFGLDTQTAAMWAGGSIHEVAQVAAVGSILGGGALSIAIIAKLTRVLLLAPVAIIVSVRQRRLARQVAVVDPGISNGQLPPLVPLFVAGFLAMVALRTVVAIPPAALDTTQYLQTGLLAAAMFALGTGVKVQNLVKVGPRPFVLAALATVLVSSIAYFGIHLAS